MPIRVEHWNPNRQDELFDHITTERLVKAAKIVKAAVRRHCPVGTISRPIYRSGPYAGKTWTSTDAGRLRKSVRVVQKKSKYGRLLAKKKNVRVYAGHYLAYYADIVEFRTPFMRPALAETLHMVRSMMGAK